MQRRLYLGGGGVVVERGRGLAVESQREVTARCIGVNRLHFLVRRAADDGHRAGAAGEAGAVQRHRADGLRAPVGERDQPWRCPSAGTDDTRLQATAQVLQRLLHLCRRRVPRNGVGSRTRERQTERAAGGRCLHRLHIAVGRATFVLRRHRQPAGDDQGVAGRVHQHLRHVRQSRIDERNTPRVGLGAGAGDVHGGDVGQRLQRRLQSGRGDVVVEQAGFLAVEVEPELAAHGGADGNFLHLVAGAPALRQGRDRRASRQGNDIDGVVAAAGIEHGAAAGAVVEVERVGLIAQRDDDVFQAVVLQFLARRREPDDRGRRQTAGDGVRVAGVVHDQLVEEPGPDFGNRAVRRQLTQRDQVAVVNRDRCRTRRVAVAAVYGAVAVGVVVELPASRQRLECGFHLRGGGIKGDGRRRVALVGQREAATDRRVREGLGKLRVLHRRERHRNLARRSDDQLRHVLVARFDESDLPRRRRRAAAGNRHRADRGEPLERGLHLVGSGVPRYRIGFLAAEHQRERAACRGRRDALDFARRAQRRELEVTGIRRQRWQAAARIQLDHPRIGLGAGAGNRHARLERRRGNQLIGDTGSGPVGEKCRDAFVLEHANFETVRACQQVRSLDAHPLCIRVQPVVVENLQAVEIQDGAVVAGGGKAVSAGGRNEDRAGQPHREMVREVGAQERASRRGGVGVAERAGGVGEIDVRDVRSDNRRRVEVDARQTAQRMADVEEFGLEPGLRGDHVRGLQRRLHHGRGGVVGYGRRGLAVQGQGERAAGGGLVDPLASSGRGIHVHPHQVLRARGKIADALSRGIREDDRPRVAGQIRNGDIADALRDFVLEIHGDDLAGHRIELGDVHPYLGRTPADGFLQHDRYFPDHAVLLAENHGRVVDDFLEERVQFVVKDSPHVVLQVPVALGDKPVFDVLDAVGGVGHIDRVVAGTAEDISLAVDRFDRGDIVAAAQHQGSRAGDGRPEGEVVRLGVGHAVEAQADVHVLHVLDQHAAVGGAVEGDAAGHAESLQAQVSSRDGSARVVVALPVVRHLDRNAAVRQRVLQRHGSDGGAALLARDGDRVADGHRAQGRIIVDGLGEEARHRGERVLPGARPEVERNRRRRHAVVDPDAPIVLRVHRAVQCHGPAGLAGVRGDDSRVGHQRLGHSAGQARHQAFRIAPLGEPGGIDRQLLHVRFAGLEKGDQPRVG